MIKLDVDRQMDDDASHDVFLTNEGSMVQTCRNTNGHEINTDI